MYTLNYKMCEIIQELLKINDPLNFIKNGGDNNEYNFISEKLYEDYIKQDILYKYNIFERFQEVYWQGALKDNLCSSLCDNINLKIYESLTNYCTVCGIDMGISNPRQLCMKTYCPDD